MKAKEWYWDKAPWGHYHCSEPLWGPFIFGRQNLAVKGLSFCPTPTQSWRHMRKEYRCETLRQLQCLKTKQLRTISSPQPPQITGAKDSSAKAGHCHQTCRQRVSATGLKKSDLGTGSWKTTTKRSPLQKKIKKTPARFTPPISTKLSRRCKLMAPSTKMWRIIWVPSPLGYPGCIFYRNYINQASPVDPCIFLWLAHRKHLPLCRLLSTALNKGTSILYMGHYWLPSKAQGVTSLATWVPSVNSRRSSSLYTSIPHDEGVNACEEFSNTRTDQSPSTKDLFQLTQLILESNVFIFNGAYYLQVLGTAMGTQMAPSYANLFMGKFKQQFNGPKTSYL